MGQNINRRRQCLFRRRRLTFCFKDLVSDFLLHTPSHHLSIDTRKSHTNRQVVGRCGQVVQPLIHIKKSLIVRANVCFSFWARTMSDFLIMWMKVERTPQVSDKMSEHDFSSFISSCSTGFLRFETTANEMEEEIVCNRPM